MTLLTSIYVVEGILVNFPKIGHPGFTTVLPHTVLLVVIVLTCVYNVGKNTPLQRKERDTLTIISGIVVQETKSRDDVCRSKILKLCWTGGTLVTKVSQAWG
jgi:hypothetical protein